MQMTIKLHSKIQLEDKIPKDQLLVAINDRRQTIFVVTSLIPRPDLAPFPDQT